MQVERRDSPVDIKHSGQDQEQPNPKNGLLTRIKSGAEAAFDWCKRNKEELFFGAMFIAALTFTPLAIKMKIAMIAIAILGLGHYINLEESNRPITARMAKMEKFCKEEIELQKQNKKNKDEADKLRIEIDEVRANCKREKEAKAAAQNN